MEYVFSKMKFSLIAVLLVILSWLPMSLLPLATPDRDIYIWILFVLSSLVLAFAIFVDRYVLRLKKAVAEERAEIYRATVWGSHLVLNNFLNKLYLIQHYAIQNGAFTEELSESMGRMIQEAAAELLELSRVDPLTAENIRGSVAPK